MDDRHQRHCDAAAKPLPFYRAGLHGARAIALALHAKLLFAARTKPLAYFAHSRIDCGVVHELLLTLRALYEFVPFLREILDD